MTRESGTVLMSGLFLLTLLSLFLLGFGRAAAVSLAHAGGVRADDRAFQAAEDALAAAIAAGAFARQAIAPTVTNPGPGIVVTTSLEYVGETVAVPHPAWDAARDAGLRAHHFRVTAEAASGPAVRALQRDFAVVAPAGIAASVKLSAAPTPANAPFGGAVIAGPWRALAR
jgi:hypothetical protein